MTEKGPKKNLVKVKREGKQPPHEGWVLTIDTTGRLKKTRLKERRELKKGKLRRTWGRRKYALSNECRMLRKGCDDKAGLRGAKVALLGKKKGGTTKKKASSGRRPTRMERGKPHGISSKKKKKDPICPGTTGGPGWDGKHSKKTPPCRGKKRRKRENVKKKKKQSNKGEEEER